MWGVMAPGLSCWPHALCARMHNLLTGPMRRESHISRGLARCTLRSTRRQRRTSFWSLTPMSMPDPPSRRSRVCWQPGPGCMFGGLEAIRQRFDLAAGGQNAVSDNALVVSTQAFPSRECFKHALVMNTQAFLFGMFSSCACDGHTSFQSRECTVFEPHHSTYTQEHSRHTRGESDRACRDAEFQW